MQRDNRHTESRTGSPTTAAGLLQVKPCDHEVHVDKYNAAIQRGESA